MRAPAPTVEVACPACSYNNHSGAHACEMCETRLRGGGSSTAATAAVTHAGAEATARATPSEIACPACTFHNLHSSTACQMCGTQLRAAPSAPAAPDAVAAAAAGVASPPAGHRILYHGTSRTAVDHILATGCVMLLALYCSAIG